MISKKAIVLAGDYGYIRQIETTLKSICYHNNNFKIYIFNQDIPVEWFRTTRQKLSLLGIELVDIKLLDNSFNMNWRVRYSHINHMTFARYFIPRYVSEPTVLYLDCDLIVTSEILHLFDIDLADNYCAAVSALHGKISDFNAGVLLINNQKWINENVTESLIDLTNREWENVLDGDQSILNMYFQNNWIHLDGKYNFPIGHDYGAYSTGQHDIFDILIDPLPFILHYISPDKPWNTFSKGRLRNVWWYYNSLDWSEIIFKQQVSIEEQIKLIETRVHSFTLTNSQYLEHIRYLIEELPDCHFHIAAYTPMGSELLSLSEYSNVNLYPNVMPVVIEQLMKDCHFYLDVNHEFKFLDVLTKVNLEGKPILSFESTKQDEVPEIVFPNDSPDLMIKSIKEIIKLKS